MIASGGGGGIGENFNSGWAGTPGSCNALLNCSSATPTPCMGLMGIEYGQGGGSGCSSSTSSAGLDGYLILMW